MVDGSEDVELIRRRVVLEAAADEIEERELVVLPRLEVVELNEVDGDNTIRDDELLDVNRESDGLIIGVGLGSAEEVPDDVCVDEYIVVGY